MFTRHKNVITVAIIQGSRVITRGYHYMAINTKKTHKTIKRAIQDKVIDVFIT